MNIYQLIDQIISEEGDAYTDNPNDSGGPTKYGITLDALSAYRGTSCTADDVQNLTQDEAHQIYLKNYWITPGFSAVAQINADIADKLADAGVNVGTGRASQWMQTALNVMNQNGALYAEITVDGAIGQQTIAALQAYLSHRGQDGVTVMLRAINDQQGAFYINDALNRPKDEDFIFGWILNRVE